MESKSNIIPESKLQSKIIRKLSNLGFLVIKILVCNRNGFPDLMALKNGKTIFIEVKSKIGKQSDLQKYRELQVNTLGFNYYLIRSLSEFQNIINQIK